jgi:hypothetical protein
MSIDEDVFAIAAASECVLKIPLQTSGGNRATVAE